MEEFISQLSGVAGLVERIIAMCEEITHLREENRLLTERLAQYETPSATRKWFKGK
jgi:regulator of replication initiation timing